MGGAITTLLLAIPSPTSALTISPFRLELTGDPGQELFGTAKLYNETNKIETYHIAFENFEAKDENGRPNFTNINDDGLASWLNGGESVTLQPQQRADIPFTINIPPDVDPGGYFAALFANTTPFSPNDNTSVSVQGQLGALILLQVNGKFKEGADILEFATKNKKRIFNALPIDFFYRFQNAGENWVKPLGDVIIKNTFGGTSKIILANPDGNNILPRSIRRFEISWLENFDPKIQRPETKRPNPPEAGFWNHVRYQWHHFAFGRYTAQLNLNYGSTSSNLAKANWSFWILPWQLMLVAGSALVIIFGSMLLAAIFIVTLILRRRERKK